MRSSSIPSSTLRIIFPKRSQIPISPKSHSLLRPKPLFFSTFPFDRLPRPRPAVSASYSPQEAKTTPPVDTALLPVGLQEIISLFQSVPDADPKAKYRQLLHYGEKLPPLDPLHKTDANRVRGCVSRVWVRAFTDPDDPQAVRFQADSDSALTKGLAALLVLGLSGSPPEFIARVPPEFVQLLGLRQSLTESRNNGFLNMLRLMQKKALLLSTHKGDAGEKGMSLNGDGDLTGSSNPGSADDIGVNDSTTSAEEKEDASQSKDGNPVSNVTAAISTDIEIITTPLEQEDTADSLLSAGDTPSGGEMRGRAERIRERLQRVLSPVELDLEDISYQHAGHAGAKGVSGGETHFNLRIVSKEFEGKSLVKRHRLVYNQLQEELQSGLHALSIVAKAPSEVGLQ